jgi:hypothetical protein
MKNVKMTLFVDVVLPITLIKFSVYGIFFSFFPSIFFHSVTKSRSNR